MSSGTVCDLYVVLHEVVSAAQCEEDGDKEIVALALAIEGTAVASTL